MLLNQHLKLFVWLTQQQLICNLSQNKQNPTKNQPWNHHPVLLIFFCFVVLLNWVINWLIINISSINFNAVIFYFHSWKKTFSVTIFCSVVVFSTISKNKQSSNSLNTSTKSFSYVFICIIFFIGSYFIFIPIDWFFKAFCLIVLIVLDCLQSLK